MRNPRTRRISVLSVLALAFLLAGGAGAQTGSADFSRYVALGDSLGAGFMSGGLVDEVQRLSYPALIFHQAAGGTPELPTVSPPGLPPLFQLASLSPLILAPAAGVGGPTNLFLQRPYDNLCVPGATVDSVLNTRTGGLHDLILRGLGTQLEQAIFMQPTFSTFWVNNDALSAATSGVVIDDVTLTSAAVFEAKYRTIIGALAANGVQLALATIPDVVTIPFVTTIPPILVSGNEPVIVNGQPVPLIGPDGPLVLGQDFVLLTATSELAVGSGIPVAFGGSGQPLSTFAVLSGAEVAAITQRVAEFNAVIRSVANETGAALVDVNAIFADVAQNGVEIGGIEFTTDFLSGGLFSYDGVHPTPLGYAVLANAWIDAINARYGASIPRVDYIDYIFGSSGSAGTGYSIVPASTSEIIFSKKAAAQLYEVMDLPTRRQLKRMLRRIRHGKPPVPGM